MIAGLAGGGRGTAARRRPLPKAQLEKVGIGVTGACVVLVIVLVATLIVMVCGQGLATFTVDGVDPWAFLTGTVWNPHASAADGQPLMGALPMIFGSFAVTLLSCAIALPVALCLAIFMVELAPEIGRTYFQPVVELLVGIPSVVYGLVGLEVVVTWTRSWAGGTGYGIFSASIVLAVMILPTITSLTVDALAAVPDAWRNGSYALGCTKWQTIRSVVVRSAIPGILTALVLGMARAFGEALAVQMVIGNAAQIPASLFELAATLTSILTLGIGNEASGTVYANALWSLALVLLVMSLAFILIVHLIGKKEEVTDG